MPPHFPSQMFVSRSSLRLCHHGLQYAGAIGKSCLVGPSRVCLACLYSRAVYPIGASRLVFARSPYFGLLTMHVKGEVIFNVSRPGRSAYVQLS